MSQDLPIPESLGDAACEVFAKMMQTNSRDGMDRLIHEVFNGQREGIISDEEAMPILSILFHGRYFCPKES